MVMASVSARYRMWVNVVLGFAFALGNCAPAAAVAADNAMPVGVQPNALLTIDQNRSTVVDRIVANWGNALELSGAGLSSAQLRTMLQGLRADHLLAASLAGSLPGLRDVLANSLTTTSNATPTRVHIKAAGDVADDLVYTPVSPCRLFDSRPAQGGLGVLSPNVRRTYGATTPVTNQGGPGSCNAPMGAAVALIQIGTLTPAGSGYLQGGPQGVASFPNALILYQPGDQYGTSVAMPLNVTNGRFDVQVQFAATDLYGDLLGYFARPKNYGGTHVITGQYATDSGGEGNTANGSHSTVGGGNVNSATGNDSTVSGGDGNTASGTAATVPGGDLNIASGNYSFAAGAIAHATGHGSFVWSDAAGFVFDPSLAGSPGHGWPNPDNTFNVRAIGGAWFVTGVNGLGNPLTGPFVNGGSGAWGATSDRAVKENFREIDPQLILARVSQLPIETWNYISEGTRIRHLGPVSQDFWAAFGLGRDDKSIISVDADGVALAAIKGLNAKLEQHIAVQQREIAELRRLVLDMGR
jgi:Chaperone of endosialidase